MKQLETGTVRATFLPSATVSVDASGDWTVVVEIADGSVERFGGVQVYIPPGWTVPQLDDATKPGYVSVIGRTAARVSTRLHTWRWITAQVDEGRLVPGDALEFHYGGAGGARAPRVSNEATEFTILVDPSGLGNYDPQPGSPVVRTTPGPAVGFEVVTPSVLQTGETMTARVKVVDALGNLVPASGEVDVVLATDGRTPVQQTVTLDARAAAAPWPVAVSAEGVWRVEVRDRHTGRAGRSPAVLVERAPEMRLFWGDIHGHSAASDGALSPDEYYTFARDVSGLDFCALTDHDDVGHNSNVPDHSKFMTQEVWQELQTVTNQYNAPGRFVTLVGFEYSQIELGIEGHRNVYYRGASGPLLHDRDPRYNTPTKLLRALASLDALVIPHHPLHYMSWEHDPRSQRLVEVYSMWGSSEDRKTGDAAFTGKMVSPGSGIAFQEYLARGYKLGVTAGGDNHDSRPGRRGATDRWRKGKMAQPPGLVAVYAPDLTREAVFDALWERRCYGTTGQRILVDFRVEGQRMGAEVTRPETAHPRIACCVLGETALASVELLRNNRVVQTWTPDAEELAVEWRDPSPVGAGCIYYVRARQADGGRAWSSPIWLTPEERR
ncbi:MAG TPA: CehA/McbA family metallohydrolase [bacterium]|nr:CehA/McbA family metallohydrolase [bacterium]